MDFITYFIKFTIIYPIQLIFQNNIKKKLNQVEIIKKMNNHFNFKLYRVSKDKINHEKNIIYFADHRSYADFFIDQITTEYCTKFISRWIVAFFLPLSAYIWSYFLHDMAVFFKRGGTNISDFEKLIKKNQINHSGNNILVYPEGTRRPGCNYAIDLKKGLIYYSYKENCPIQFIISKNKEKIWMEKKFGFNKDVDIFVYYSDVYYPNNQKYKSMLEYYDYINSEWKTTFNLVYNTDYDTEIEKYEQISIEKTYNDNYYIDTRKRWFVRVSIISFIVIVPSIVLKSLFSLLN
jgi:1-acyl-sn-glycerol-3-phosphate acyltransferase